MLKSPKWSFERHNEIYSHKSQFRAAISRALFEM